MPPGSGGPCADAAAHRRLPEECRRAHPPRPATDGPHLTFHQNTSTELFRSFSVSVLSHGAPSSTRDDRRVSQLERLADLPEQPLLTRDHLTSPLIPPNRNEKSYRNADGDFKSVGPSHGSDADPTR